MPAEARLPEPWRHPVFHDLQRRIEELEEENRQLRLLLVPEAILPRAWRLTPAETRLVLCVAHADGPVTFDSLRVAIARAGRDVSDQHIAVVLVHARRKLAAHDVRILAVRPCRLIMPPEGRAIVRAAVAAITGGTAV